MPSRQHRVETEEKGTCVESVNRYSFFAVIFVCAPDLYYHGSVFLCMFRKRRTRISEFNERQTPALPFRSSARTAVLHARGRAAPSIPPPPRACTFIVSRIRFSRPALSSAARKESLFFNGTQDSRWLHVGREKIAPFRPLRAPLSCSFGPASPLPSSALCAPRRARAHRRMHARATDRPSTDRGIFSVSLSPVDICNFRHSPPIVAMLIGFFFFTSFTVKKKRVRPKSSLRSRVYNLVTIFRTNVVVSTSRRSANIT